MEKLQWERELITEVGWTDTRKAIFALMNAFISAWHLAEWTWHALTEAERAALGLRKLDDYRASVRSRCPGFGMCDQIANASKHSRRDRNNEPQLITRSGPRMKLTQKAPSPPLLRMRLGVNFRLQHNGGEVNALHVLDDLITFWTGELEQLELTARSP